MATSATKNPSAQPARGRSCKSAGPGFNHPCGTRPNQAGLPRANPKAGRCPGRELRGQQDRPEEQEGKGQIQPSCQPLSPDPSRSKILGRLVAVCTDNLSRGSETGAEERRQGSCEPRSRSQSAACPQRAGSEPPPTHDGAPPAPWRSHNISPECRRGDLSLPRVPEQIRCGATQQHRSMRRGRKQRWAPPCPSPGQQTGSRAPKAGPKPNPISFPSPPQLAQCSPRPGCGPRGAATQGHRGASPRSRIPACCSGRGRRV